MRDVLILGGGRAGTTTALNLADREITAAIIEARGRLGGRAAGHCAGAARGLCRTPLPARRGGA